MLPPRPDPAWPDDVQRLYQHDLQEMWDPTLAPPVWNQYHDQLERYMALVPTHGTQRVLDVGCAQGTLALLLAERGHEVTAVDVRPRFLAYAASRRERGRVEFVCADALELDLGPRFDVVFCNQLIEHLVRPARLLERLRAHLVPGGRLVVTTPNGRYLRSRLPSFRALGDPERYASLSHSADGDGHFFAYLPRELQGILEGAGLRNVRVRPFETPFASGHMRLRHLHGIVPLPVLRLLDRLTLSLPAVGAAVAHQLLATGRA